MMFRIVSEISSWFSKVFCLRAELLISDKSFQRFSWVWHCSSTLLLRFRLFLRVSDMLEEFFVFVCLGLVLLDFSPR